jgi:hypothetical protein
MGKLRYLELAATVLCLATLSNAAPAQEKVEVQAHASEQRGGGDEITVTRKRLSTLKKEVEIAQDEMYEAFNEHNSDDRLDIHCTYERPLGSRISRRVCRPAFVDSATSRAGKEFMWYMQRACPDPRDTQCIAAATDVGGAPAQEAFGTLALMARRLDAELQRLAHENVDVAKAAAAYQAKRLAYQEALQPSGE